MKLYQIFNKKDNGKGYLITKLILSSAVRKFISRFLSGKRNAQDINPEFELFNYLQCREDIWKKEIKENANFDREMSEFIEIGIQVKNALNLYEVLGGDKSLLGEEVKKEMQIEEKKIEEENKQKMKNQELIIEEDQGEIKILFFKINFKQIIY